MPERGAESPAARPLGQRRVARRRPRYSEEQILRVLRESAAGTADEALCAKYGVSRKMLAKWRAERGVLGPSDARRLKQLEEENRRLRSIVADLTLSNQALKLAVSKKW